LPTIKKNISKKALTKDERAEFDSVGYSESETDKFDDLLKRTSWNFWSKAEELFLSLSAGSDVIMKSGKLQSVDTSLTIKFTKHYADTSSREVAKNIFLSDPYRERKIKLVEDQVMDESAKQYSEFKTAVLSNPENVERLRRDLESIPVE